MSERHVGALLEYRSERAIGESSRCLRLREGMCCGLASGRWKCSEAVKLWVSKGLFGDTDIKHTSSLNANTCVAMSDRLETRVGLRTGVRKEEGRESNARRLGRGHVSIETLTPQRRCDASTLR